MTFQHDDDPRRDGTPSEETRFEPDRPSPWAVILGVLAGFAASVFFPLLVMPLLDQFSTEAAGWGLGLVGFVLPVLGLVALLVPSWRRSAAGFVMGLAIGAIVFGGVCVAFLSSMGAW